MNRRRAALALLLALPTLSAVAAEADSSPPEKGRRSIDYSVRAVGGAFDGVGVHRGSGPILELEADAKPILDAGPFRVAIPLRLDHRETFGADLDETVVGAAVDASYRGERIEHGPELGYSYTWRPDWPDLFQPECGSGTELCPTDRYSHSQLDLAYSFWAKLGGGKHLRASARWVRSVYPEDPDYDPSVSVVHLAPSSNSETQLDASFRHLIGPFGYLARIDWYSRTYDDLLAKNALTGGTTRTNPDEKLTGAELRGELQLRTKPVDLSAGYGYLTQTDQHEGYYSYTGSHPYAEAKAQLPGRLSVEARVDSKRLRFGPDSKQATEDGKRLVRTRTTFKGAVRYELRPALFLVGEGSVTKRDTNFPDYVPGVFPVGATRQYDIDWDYTNWTALAGLEWRP